MATEFTVQVDMHTVSNVTVEADTEEEALHLVSNISELDLSELFDNS